MIANKHKIFYLIIFSLSISFPQLVIAAEENNEEQQIENEMYTTLNMEDISYFWKELQSEYGAYMPEFMNKSLTEFVKDDESISLKSSIQGILKFLFYEIIENGKLLGSLIILTLFSVVLQTMYASFENSVVSKIAYFIIFIVLISIVLNSFYLVFTYTKDTIDMMSSFLIALLPLILGLIATFGQVITVSFFHPIVLFLIHASGILVTTFIFPLLYLSALLTIVSQLNDKFQATHLAELFRTVGMSVLGVFLTIFLGVMSVQGAAAAIQDGVALKTTKFITGNFIPVVGRTFTEAADTVLSATLLLKNAIGIIGVIIIIFIAVFPAIKIIVISFIYKLAAALLQPLGNSPIIESLNTISKYIMYVLACLFTVTFMFFLAIVLLTVASNLPLLIR